LKIQNRKSKMGAQPSHYQTLEVSPQATQAEIKQAYRRLVKRFHPDSQSQEVDREKIVSLNAAYEIVGDPQHRQLYDLEQAQQSDRAVTRRQQRTAQAQDCYRQQRQAARESEAQLAQWYKEVYLPVNRSIDRILNPLKRRIQDLAADPFDDRLMEDFQDYIADCRQSLTQAQQIFASQPNPAKVATTAANLYYCLERIGDGLDEFDWFILNYDDRHLHSGTEMFRIADRLRGEVRASVISN
jgi:molecular chaperone DnaJ